MPRYFIEVCYKGANYSGFQQQDNAPSIQQEVEKALATLFRKALVQAGEEGLKLTGSSRTDAGVHALQNYFHVDSPFVITPKHAYNLNALLPGDIAINNIHPVAEAAHCRFDALSRRYKYYIYQHKNPFLASRAYYYPYTLNVEGLNQVAALILGQHNFSAFSKRNTQVKTFICTIYQAQWAIEDDCLVFTVCGNRFLRGMVRGLVGTMLRVSKQPQAVENFSKILASGNCTLADFSVPGHGLFLVNVNYPRGYFNA
jgi:tRNA pseudouridine38-40 synthase